MCREYVAVRRDAVEWLKKHYPALCEKSGLCERIGGRLYTLTTLSHPGVEERPVATVEKTGD